MKNGDEIMIIIKVHFSPVSVVANYVIRHHL